MSRFHHVFLLAFLICFFTLVDNVSASMEDLLPGLEELCDDYVKQGRCQTDRDRELMVKYCGEKICENYQKDASKIKKERSPETEKELLREPATEKERLPEGDRVFFRFQGKHFNWKYFKFRTFRGLLDNDCQCGPNLFARD